MQKKMQYILPWIGLIIFGMILFPDFHVSFIKEILFHFPGLDKTIHYIQHVLIILFAYYVLGFLKLKWHPNIKIIASVAISFTISIADEFHQILIPGRSFEIADLFANVLGAFTGIVILKHRRLGKLLAVLFCTILLFLSGYLTYDSFKKGKPFYEGIAYERDGNYLLARDQYLMAIKQGNKSAGLYNNLAWLEVEFLDGDPGIAYDYVKVAFEKAPGQPDILDTYGWILFLLERHEEALFYLKKAYKLDPDIFCINYHLGVVYLATGDRDKGQKHLLQQVSQNPDDRFGNKAKIILNEL